MVRLEDIARAAIDGEALRARSLTQDWLAQHARLEHVPPPEAGDAVVRAVAAGLIEWFAMNRGEAAPEWTAQIGAIDDPIFLVRHAATMPRLRELCRAEGPEPLRRRRIYAPPGYLVAA